MRSIPQAAPALKKRQTEPIKLKCFNVYGCRHFNPDERSHCDTMTQVGMKGCIKHMTRKEALEAVREKIDYLEGLVR